MAKNSNRQVVLITIKSGKTDDTDLSVTYHHGNPTDPGVSPKDRIGIHKRNKNIHKKY